MKHLCFLAFLALSSTAFGRDLMPLPGAREAHRVQIENRAGGEIRGSRDGGVTWKLLGHVIAPAMSALWKPTIDSNAMSFDYLRGPSTVFAAAVDVLHIKLSDPEGYTLPADPGIRPVPAHGFTVLPLEKGLLLETEAERERSVVTDIPGGTGIFGSEWNTRAGAQVLFSGTPNGDFLPIPYELGAGDPPLFGSSLLITTEALQTEVEWIEFENAAGGRILVKRQGEEPVHVAKVIQPVSGIGRFAGTEFIRKPGNLRVNTGGVICIATTDVHTDPAISHPVPAGEILGIRGGFQVVPTQHWGDEQMVEAHGHPEVYLIVGPIVDPLDLRRYDQGIEGTYPLFHRGLDPGKGETRFKFQGDDVWYELSVAQALGKFKRRDGTAVEHLRGYIPDALVEVAAIRFIQID